MRLLDLDPRWLLRDGKRVGFVFESPTQGDNMHMSCFEAPPPRQEQWALFRDALGEDYRNRRGYRACVQGMRQEARWTIAGGIENASFETLTVTPSLDGSSAGNWHGFITHGQIVGGI